MPNQKMRSINRNFIRFAVLPMIIGMLFVAGNFVSVSVSAAGTGSPSLPAPTPTPKKPAVKVTPTPKPTPKKTATPAPTPKPAATPKAEQQKIIVSTPAARVREGSNTGATEIRRMKLGTVLTVLERTSGSNFWYKVQLPTSSKPPTGWMSSTVVNNFDSAKSDTLYRQIAQKNYKAGKMAFNDATELYEFLTRVAPGIKNAEISAELGLRRLQALSLALTEIPMARLEDAQYKKFTTAQNKNIVYSDPAGQYFVRAELFWNLHKKYAGTAIGEQIAWAGARNNLPGECEGYVVCNLYQIAETDGRYLSHYPDGKHSVEALKMIIDYLEPMADPAAKSVYTGPTDLSDRAEFNKYLNDLRQTVSKLPHVEKDTALRHIKKMAEMYR